MWRVLSALTEAPTVVFTALLAFSLAWWLVSLAVGAVGGHHDVGGHGGHGMQAGGHAVKAGGRVASARVQGRAGGHRSTGKGGARSGRHGGATRVGHWFGLGSMPWSLALLVTSFGAWSVSLVVAVATGGHHAWGAATGLGVGAGVVGLLLNGAVARPTSRVFALASAPERADAVASLCRVRTAYADPSFGHAEMITGPMTGSLVAVRTTQGRLERGDVALVVAHRSDDMFVIDADDRALFDD